ncbi:MAG: isoleucine--tRNA ligase [Patescibacteria group bacterium]|nr:isoleucine--tRNA ligase [Patescibacteria group bacterium]
MSDVQRSDIAWREEEILKFWNEHGIFKKSLQKGGKPYVFYDGPPFATGLPHYGHIVASVIKDAVPRYFTMRGYHVPRVWGWDCHGLPIENIVEKELGFKHKKDIVQYGVAKFNERCREQVLTYASEWEKIIPRIGRWADMEHAYRTMDKPFMESVWWVFKQLWDKGLVYEDYRSMHVCPRCETTLSQQEVSEGYKDVKDIAVTAKFKVKNPEKIGLSGDVYMLAWTTTPWTLPGNVALAVGMSIEYTDISVGSEHIIVASNYAQKIDGTIGKRMKGTDLVGLEYEPPFDYYINDKNLKNRENGWKVYAADFVTTDTGTGIAHEAPAFGADDWALLKKENLPFVQHVNMDGSFKPEVKDGLGGMEVKPKGEDNVRLAADIAVLKYLKVNNLLFGDKENITHPYPHCWRCDSPLLNYATSSWFVKIEAQKGEILKNARPISWSPAHIKEGRWGKWLEGARDWSISRQRFWASVIPLWQCQKTANSEQRTAVGCGNVRVFGSTSELEEASGRKVEDLHKHIVDEITFSCEKCGGTMHRIPDVLDTWFDSGSMPYGERHYPFEKKEEFDRTFPAQFIAEGLDQTRAWFYYLHILATSLFGKEAFQNVIVNGIVLAEDGKKMSKRLQNYPDPMEVVEKHGADALRYYLLSSPVMQAENLAFSEKGVDEVAKKNIGRLANVLAFYQLYADPVKADAHGMGSTPRDWKSEHILDRWILARLDELIREATRGFEAYKLDAATRPIAGFIDDLSVWYLRRSRDRFKEEGADKVAALATLRYVLHRLSLVMAPSMPFFAEHLFQAVREGEDEESVHLAAWPEARATANFIQRILGRGGEEQKLLRAMQAARRIVSQALEERDKAGIKVRQPLQKLTVNSEQLTEEFLGLIKDEVNVKSIVVGRELSLDITLTDKLREEGVVRDAIRTVQAARKAAKLNPKDHATLAVDFSDLDAAVIKRNLEHIQKETNTSIKFS